MANFTLRFSYGQLAAHGLSAFGCLLLLAGLLLAARHGHAQGFSSTATPWALPAGGYATTSHDYSYPTLAYTNTSNTALDHTWATLDMNGDAKPDLVILTEGNGAYNEPFGTGSTGRYWKVHLNTGSGYASTAVAWALPAGGRIVTGSGRLASFDALAYAGSAYTGNQGWTVKDMNGDARPDLVVLTQGNGTYNEAIGLGSTNRSWLVYLNTGTGFATTALTWSLPAGGYVDGAGHVYSYLSLTFDNGSVIGGGQAWFVLDMNGDSKPDLVTPTENYLVFGPNTNAGGRYWKVYLNTGTGYAAAATTWPLPPGGFVFSTGGIGGSTYYASFNGTTHRESNGSNTGNQEWDLLDMNGDNRPDLAVPTEADGTYLEPFGTGTARYWKVYLNNGSGFSTTATNWALPAGGGISVSTGRQYSFNWFSGEGSGLIGNQTWAVRDLDGDRKPDLVVLREGTGTYDDVFGTGSTRYWKVYLNTGTGYATTTTTWSLPAGGYLTTAHNYSFASLAAASYSGIAGSQTWAVLDINGDAKSDLVVLTERNSAYDEPFGTGTGRYWKAYLNSATGLATRPALGGGSVELFPNPAAHTFTLRLPALGTERTARLTLLNTLGQTVQTRDVALRPGGTDAQVDVSALAAGLYTVRVQAGGQTAAQQVVVE